MAPQGLDQPRMPVPERAGPPGRVPVDVAVAVDVAQPDTLGLGDHQRVHPLPVVLHLRVGVPHPLLVGGDDAFTQVGHHILQSSADTKASKAECDAGMEHNDTGLVTCNHRVSLGAVFGKAVESCVGRVDT